MLSKIIDHHVHSNFSPDGNSSIEEIIHQGLELGVDGIMLTDHLDFDSSDPLYRNYINYTEYEAYIKTLNYPIDIFMGVEIGYQPHLNDRLNQFLCSHPFDFVICSIHALDNLNFSQKEYMINKSPNEVFLRYYEEVLYTVKNYHNYDVLGHLDIIKRYVDNSDYNLKNYIHIVDEILITLIKNQKGIEINTSGYQYGLNSVHPSIDIIKRYKELGGTLITLGSDSHFAKDLQSKFNEMIDLLSSLGFTHVMNYKRRVPYPFLITNRIK